MLGHVLVLEEFTRKPRFGNSPGSSLVGSQGVLREGVLIIPHNVGSREHVGFSPDQSRNQLPCPKGRDVFCESRRGWAASCYDCSAQKAY